MASYTNKKGDKVTVSQEHLDTAVALKIKLQKDSSGNRTSWRLHRQLMIKEGFEDSENSEAYRQMIKIYQNSIGKLPSAMKHADMVATKKIESYKELVGEVTWEKRETQKYLSEIRKGKREIIDEGLWIVECRKAIKDSLKEIKLKLPSPSPVIVADGTRLIAFITDWHIGALVDLVSNKYNYEIAKQRVADFTYELIEYAKRKKSNRIDVAYLGDLIEHSYMRYSQSYEVEFPISKQMVKGANLIVSMLCELVKEGYYVTYRGIAGNHDRMSEKDTTIDGDTAMHVANEIIEEFIKKANSKQLEYIESDYYSGSILDVNGRNIKLRHGDLDKKLDKGKIAKYSINDKVTYDVIVFGHYHHYELLEIAQDRYELYVGSLKGTDSYAEKNGWSSSPSQVVMSVTPHGEMDFVMIKVN